MIPIKRVDRITQVADAAVKIEAALGELHHCHRFGRYSSLFPQKPYFLFSHCAHLLFSLWLDEQNSATKVFAESQGLTVLFNKVDFGALRYLDYSRRMLYANAYEEHLKNEPKWFKLWIKALQELQGSEAGAFEEFYKQFFACLSDCSVLEGKLTRRDQKALTGLVQSPRAGRLLLRSTWILEDVISTASSHIARLDPAPYAIEQMQILICLLSQLRRTIVRETSARGPYTLSTGGGWDAPSTFGRFFSRKTSGLLTVTPGEGDGQVTCTYAGNAGSKVREHTWTRSIAALPCAYEELLFKTWPQNPREQSRDGETPAQTHWIVPAMEAGHLETVSRHADALLARFGKYPAYGSFVETAAQVLRNGRQEWTSTELPWGYIHKLDQLMNKLKFACREAKVLGGGNPVEKVVANLWPPRCMPPQETIESPALEDRERQTDLSEEPEPISLESILQPQCYKGRGCTDQPPTAQDGDCSRQAQSIPSMCDASDDVAVKSATQALVWRLLEWHRQIAEGHDHKPLSLVQLQNDLGWTQSKVLQTMNKLFGNKPFALYTQKCVDKSIRSFLEDSRVRLKEGSESNAQTLCSSTG
jgi:hypothetical protein